VTAGILQDKEVVIKYISIRTNGIVVVPDHGANKDLAIGTEINILKQAGLK
jgi:predicted RNA binding protein YcfA (HicA-like mRNA interferase family)